MFRNALKCFQQQQQHHGPQLYHLQKMWEPLDLGVIYPVTLEVYIFILTLDQALPGLEGHFFMQKSTKKAVTKSVLQEKEKVLQNLE